MSCASFKAMRCHAARRQARCNADDTSPITPSTEQRAAARAPAQRGDSRCRGAIRAAGLGDREAVAAARARGAPGRNHPARRRPISRSFCAAARISCAPCCRAATSAARGLSLIVLAAVVIWGFSGFFRVEPDELGVVLRFGKFVRDAKPGLNYHLPYPIETVLTPRSLRVNSIDVGMRVVEDVRRGTTHSRRAGRKPDAYRRREYRRCRFLGLLADQARRAGDYLFNIQQPEGTVKAVAESAMREVVGRSNIQPILTGARQNIETGCRN